jgi:SAM-dependent methyltransferase
MARNTPGARFSKTAELYDLVYHFKDYRGDAGRIAKLLVDNGLQGGARVLEGACGTGAYLQFLRGVQRYGYDLDPEMVALARRRVPDATVWQGDLAAPSIPEPMDAILLLFGAVGYVPPERLSALVDAHADALVDGGLMLVEPWLQPDAFLANRPHMATYETPFLKIARQCVTRREGGWSVLDFHFLVSRPDFAVEHLQTTDRLWLYTHDELVEALGRRFTVTLTEQGFMEDKALFICQRR